MTIAAQHDLDYNYELRFLIRIIIIMFLQAHGSDAMHTDPDYSCAYVVIKTDNPDGHEGHGLTFTCGRGTEVGRASNHIIVSIRIIINNALQWSKLQSRCPSFSLVYHSIQSRAILLHFGAKSRVKASSAGCVKSMGSLL
jgi:hypothetical protein